MIARAGGQRRPRAAAAAPQGGGAQGGGCQRQEHSTTKRAAARRWCCLAPAAAGAARGSPHALCWSIARAREPDRGSGRRPAGWQAPGEGVVNGRSTPPRSAPQRAGGVASRPPQRAVRVGRPTRAAGLSRGSQSLGRHWVSQIRHWVYLGGQEGLPLGQPLCRRARAVRHWRPRGAPAGLRVMIARAGGQRRPRAAAAAPQGGGAQGGGCQRQEHSTTKRAAARRWCCLAPAAAGAARGSPHALCWSIARAREPDRGSGRRPAGWQAPGEGVVNGRSTPPRSAPQRAGGVASRPPQRAVRVGRPTRAAGLSRGSQSLGRHWVSRSLGRGTVTGSRDSHWVSRGPSLGLVS